MNVRNKPTLFVLTFAVCFFSLNGNGQNAEKEILLTIQDYYKRCLTSEKIGSENLFLTPLLPIINTPIDDSIRVAGKLKKYIPEEDWQSVSSDLLKWDQTYWKPTVPCDYGSFDDFPSSICKPIIYAEEKKAAVIGYWLKKGFQTVIFLAKKEDDWKIVGDVNVGIYLKKSGKISESKVPSKR